MFNAMTIFVIVLLVVSFGYNIYLAYITDKYETTIKKVAASYWRAYRDLAEGEHKTDVFDTLMRNIDHDLND